MTVIRTAVETSPEPDVHAAAAVGTGEQDLSAEPLLVEDVSIDGMCGVY